MQDTPTLPMQGDPVLATGPPRSEIDAAIPDAVPAAAHEAALVFDGQGADYWRLWVVHTLLNVLTLGLYSPWAKVRKARWFAQHTVLLGDRFDYHGRPWPILAGRLLALALLVLWSYSFDISRWFGLGMLALLCGVGPLLFASAQRFRLANTSWRGLRFGFRVPRSSLFLVCVPALLLWTLATVLKAWGAREGVVLTASGLGTLCLPWAHSRLKWMQHSNARFAGRSFRFDAAAWPFYKVYFSGFFALIGAALVAFLAGFWASRIAANNYAASAGVVAGLLSGLVTAVLMWTFTWPYFAARLQQLVWSRTHWGDVGFRGTMRAWRLLRILVAGIFLTLVTLGLYWPFLAVAIAKYRVESLSVLMQHPPESLQLAAEPDAGATAAGDATADFFGLDLGW